MATEKGKKNSLYMVEFKAGRTDFFYVPENNNMIRPKVGDLVIVEADRGKDLGKVAMNNLSYEQVTLLQSQKNISSNTNNGNLQDTSSSITDSEVTPIINESSSNTEHSSTQSPSSTFNQQYVKQIYRLAQRDEINQLLLKKQDEQSALAICQQKIKQRKLRMDVVDAEYQWDRRKLTFYFIAERRIDFRELVRELFKVYKTRIWM
ncbi:PSP1 C-terminal conserved region-domain-containing protein [Phascolomyces articulosus]|uniref:PSP1 C-terminal conserved region-domain-containing protein n=1 Tax=Phascolomyces articulosus TaxID=60185 RepID=A0AAD5JK34_9FUNG|nr:PSP1 C-terminal conserved region-domain-containing protein [Phascolomyces articulosus]